MGVSNNPPVWLSSIATQVESRLSEFLQYEQDRWSGIDDDLGIPLIIGVLSNQRTEAKIRLYERQFGAPAGAFFLYNVHTGHENVTEH